MSDAERKRNLSDSSDSDEDTRKSARKERSWSGSDLTGVTGSDSSSSDSDSSGSSSASSDSSGSDTPQKKLRSKLDPRDPVLSSPPSVADHDSEPEIGQRKFSKSSSTKQPSAPPSAPDHPASPPQLAQSSKVSDSTTVQNLPLSSTFSETLNLKNISSNSQTHGNQSENSSHLKCNNNSRTMNSHLEDARSNSEQAVSERDDLYLDGAQDDILQFLDGGSEGFLAGGGEGFVDPVFVDHEDSQNAAILDTLVFENDEGRDNHEDEDFLNDPRLGTICSNSTSMGNSDKGSINLNEMEEGELPSSPESELESAPDPPPLDESSEPAAKQSSSSSSTLQSAASSYISKMEQCHSQSKQSLTDKHRTDRGGEKREEGKHKHKEEKRSHQEQKEKRSSHKSGGRKDESLSKRDRSRSKHKEDKSSKNGKEDKISCVTKEVKVSKKEEDLHVSLKQEKTSSQQHREDRSYRNEDKSTSHHRKRSSSGQLKDESGHHKERRSGHQHKDKRTESKEGKSQGSHKEERGSSQQNEERSSNHIKADRSLGLLKEDRSSHQCEEKNAAQIKEERRSFSKHSKTSEPSQYTTSQSRPKDNSDPESDLEREKSRKRKKYKKRRDKTTEVIDSDDDSEFQRSRSSKKRKEKSPSPKIDKSKGGPPVSSPDKVESCHNHKSKLENIDKDTKSISCTVPDPSIQHNNSTDTQLIKKPAKDKSPAEDKEDDDDMSREQDKHVLEEKSASSSETKSSSTVKSTKDPRKLHKSSKSAKVVPPPPLPPPAIAPPPPSPSTQPTKSPSRSPMSNSKAMPSPSRLSPQSKSPPSESKSMPSQSKSLPSCQQSTPPLQTNALPSQSKQTYPESKSPTTEFKSASKSSVSPDPEPKPATETSCKSSDAKLHDGGESKVAEGSSSPMHISSNDEGSVCKESHPMDPPESEDSKDEGPSKRKKLSLKDYKLKREAERARKSIEGESGSEPPSQAGSTATSKEPSPEPGRDEIQRKEGNFVDDTNNGEEGNDFLRGFDILDEVENDSDSDSKSGIYSSDDLDELDDLLEQDVKKNQSQVDPIVPEERFKKLVMVERGGTEFEVLPLGWVIINHNSGIPVYLHKDSRVISCSRPYSLGDGSVRNHNIPISAIPCFSYRYYSEKEEKQPSSSDNTSPGSSADAASVDNSCQAADNNLKPVSSAATAAKEQKQPVSKGYSECPFSSGYGRENVSPDSTTPNTVRDETPMEVETPGGDVSSGRKDDTSEVSGSSKDDSVTVSASGSHEVPANTSSKPDDPAAVSGSQEAHAGPPESKAPTVECIEEKKQDLTTDEVQEYCMKLFAFKEVEVAKFKSWKDRRSFMKQEKRKQEQLSKERPSLPDGTKVITIPTVELKKMEEADGDSALNQQVVKKSKKKWVLNPTGKSMVCLLHEYVQQSLRSIPKYEFTELDNASTPYSATVSINQIIYGRGDGPSKKIAKARAARQTLEMMIPTIKDKLPDPESEKPEDGPDLKFFNGIRVEDPRVAELCNRASEPGPYYILLTCLQRNYGLGDTSIHTELKAARNGKMEFLMSVNKKEVSVICKNKKDGKQLAAQKLLQQLHPNIGNWGSLLRMYGNRSARNQKQKKMKESEVLALQSKNSGNSGGGHSIAILNKLKQEMRNLQDIRNAVVPIGKFQPPSGVSISGLNTDHVDI